MTELKNEYDGFISVDSAIREFNFSRKHMNLLINRGYVNTAIFNGIHYMGATQYERFVDMLNKEKVALSEMFEKNDRIREDAVKEIAALLEE